MSSVRREKRSVADYRKGTARALHLGGGKKSTTPAEGKSRGLKKDLLVNYQMLTGAHGAEGDFANSEKAP